MKRSFWDERVHEMMNLYRELGPRGTPGYVSASSTRNRNLKTRADFSRPAGGMLMALLVATLLLAMLVQPAHAQNVQGQGGGEDIRDIQGIISLAGLEWWIYVGALVALAGLAFQIWLLKRRRPAAVEPESPETIAFRELDGARELLHEGMAREFSLDVSEVLRRYIEERFHVPVVQRTTEEFLQDMRRSRLPGVLSHLDELDIFLRLCDQAKFGGEALTLSEMETMWTSARAFVEQSGLALALGRDVAKETSKAPVEPQSV